MGMLGTPRPKSVYHPTSSVRRASVIPARLAPRLSHVKMSNAWPLPDPDPVLEEAHNIALDYLAATGQVGDDTRSLVASSIMTSWREGMRHRIQLANAGIVAVQQFKIENLKTGDVSGFSLCSLPQLRSAR